MTNIQKCLASNIKNYRKLLGLTQEQLAEKIGTSTNYIGTIETCKKFPSPKMIEKIASALKINSSQLFQNDEKNLQTEKYNISALKRSLLKNIKSAIDGSLSEL